MKSVCILFMAHFIDDAIINEFRILQRSCWLVYDVKLLYDNSKGDFPFELFDNDEFELFTLDSLKSKHDVVPYWKGERPEIYGNLDIPILDFAERNEYDYVWRVEYDVRYTGDWENFFDSFYLSTSDLLGTTIMHHSACPDWFWWESVEGPTPVPYSDLIRGFFPVLRLSKAACEVLSCAHRSGWKGHFEATLCTILNRNGLTIEDIGGCGDYVRESNRGRNYSNTQVSPYLWPGTFVWRFPDGAGQHDFQISDSLYHPCPSAH